MKIKNAVATYTGGNIYIYTGQFVNGRYFVASDLLEGVTILSKPFTDDYEDYVVGFAGSDVFCNILRFIIDSGYDDPEELEIRIREEQSCMKVVNHE